MGLRVESFEDLGVLGLRGLGFRLQALGLCVLGSRLIAGLGRVSL